MRLVCESIYLKQYKLIMQPDLLILVFNIIKPFWRTLYIKSGTERFLSRIYENDQAGQIL